MATRALIGYLENGVLTSTYNHYDGYPENLGKALNQFYSTPEKAKEIANRGYISYVDPETGEIEAANQDTPDKLNLNKMDPNQAIEEVARLVDSYGADFAYFFSPNASKWDYVKNYGIRQMSDALEGILFGDFDNTYGDEEQVSEGEMSKVMAQAMFKLQDEPKHMLKAYKDSLANDIRLNGPEQYADFSVEDFIEDYENYMSDKMDLEESFKAKWQYRAGIKK
jgi:hypothetical protein